MTDAGLTFRTDFGARLSGLLDEFETRTEASEVAGVTADMLPRYARGVVKPPFEVIARLCKIKGVSIDWLWSGEGSRRVGGEPPPGDTISVEVVDLSDRLSQGTDVRHLPIPRELVAKIILPDSRLRAAFAPDRMNEPLIGEGDLLLFDNGAIDVDIAAFYIFRRDHSCLLRWAEYDLRGGVLLKGSPGDKTQLVLTKDELAEVRIIGRVVWRAGQV